MSKLPGLNALKKFTAAVIAANTGTASGSWAAGDDSRIVGAATKLSPTFSSAAASETATIDGELIDGTGWTLGAGWTGDYATSFAHSSGTATLTRTMTGTGTKLYQVEFTVSAQLAADELTVTLGGSAPFDLYFYGQSPTRVKVGIQSVSDGDLVFTPVTGFTKSISAVSVREITAASTPLATWKDSANAVVGEYRATTSALGNTFRGVNSGRWNTAGYANAALGKDAMGANTSGFWNVALGHSALKSNRTGTRNTALGFEALKDCVTGMRNIGIGSYALNRVTSGDKNVAIGSDCGWYITTGSNNLAAGFSALSTHVSGTYNVALGSESLKGNVSGSHNIGLGFSALAQSTGSEQIAIGKYAGYAITSAIENVIIGTAAMQCNVTGNGNTVVGFQAGLGTVSGSQTKSTIVGARAGMIMQDAANSNTLIGYKAGANITTASSCVIIGADVDAVSATANDQLNIKNTIYGDLNLKRIGINVTAPTAKLHLPAGGTAANSAPLKFTTGSLMDTPQAGAIEYDGTHVYFTDSSAVRHTLAVVA